MSNKSVKAFSREIPRSVKSPFDIVICGGVQIHIIQKGHQVIKLHSLTTGKTSPELNIPIPRRVEICHHRIRISAHGKQGGVLNFEWRVPYLGIQPEKSLGPIFYFVNCTPFKEVFYLVQTLPELGGSSGIGFKEGLISHVFCL